MKTAIAILMMLGSSAFADGFTCYTQDGVLKISVFNHTQPERGTRTGHILIVSDLTVNDGNKTIATFTDEEGTLDSEGANYRAFVTSSIAKKGRNIAGTKLGFVRYLTVHVDHLYSSPVEDGEALRGELVLIKANLDTVHEPLSCIRYLKN